MVDAKSGATRFHLLTGVGGVDGGAGVGGLGGGSPSGGGGGEGESE